MDPAGIMASVTQSEHTGDRPFTLQRCTHPAVDEVFSRRRIPLGNGSWTDMQVYIPREEGDFIYSLVRHLRPSLTVEVGMANGLSTLFIASALRENEQGRHVAIDPFQVTAWRSAGIALLRYAGLSDYVELVEKHSHQALPELERMGHRAQFVFIDGSHLFDFVIADFLCADRILDVGGLIVFDDSDWPAIAQTLRFVVQNRRYDVPYPHVVIEDPMYHPTLAGRLVRRAARAFASFGAKLRPDFILPSYELRLRGRCVAIRKLGEDDRDSQSNFHVPF